MHALSAWMLPVASLFALTVLVTLAVRALSGDRAQGRRRCAKCWHEFGPRHDAAATTLRCVECGWIAPNEAALARPRRRWLWCATWIACASALGLSMQVHFASTNFWTLAPTQVLLWSIDLTAPLNSSQPARDELVRRILRSGWTDSAQQSVMMSMLSRRASDDAVDAQEWKARWERPMRAWLATVDATEATRDALLAVPVECNVRAPLHPLVDGDHHFVLSVNDFWPESVEGRVEILSPAGVSWSVLFDPAGYRDARTGCRFSPSPSNAPYTLRTSWRVKTGADGSIPPWNMLDEQTLSIAVEPAQSADALLTPIDSPALREAVASAFSDGLIRWTGAHSRVGLRFDVGATASEEFRDVLIGVRATIRNRDAVVRVSELWWSARHGDAFGWSMSEEDRAALALATEGTPEGWTLTIEGNRDAASFLLTDARNDTTQTLTLPLKYFSGVVTLPLRVTDHASAAPPRRFAPEFVSTPTRD